MNITIRLLTERRIKFCIEGASEIRAYDKYPNKNYEIIPITEVKR